MALLALCIVLAIVLLAWPPPHSAEKQQATEQTHQKKANENPLVALWRWTTHDPVAFYTAALVLVTGVLGGIAIVQIKYLARADETARITAEAAKNSANALVSAERAHLFVQVRSQSVQDLILRAAMSNKEMAVGHIEPRLQVSYAVKNFGKTPAILREINHELVPLVDLPTEPSYSKPRGLPYKSVLAQGDETTTIDCVADDWLTVEQAKEIAAGKCSMWFIGRVVYEDVVTGRERVEPFLYRYAGDGFNPDYREAYNKRS